MLSPMIDTESVLGQARNAGSLFEVGTIAASMLRQHFTGGAGLVLSPITSGGIMVENAPSHKENIKALEKKIRELGEHNEEGVPIFNQLLFKGCIDRHRKMWELSDKSHNGVYYDMILHEFYGPILSTGLIRVGYFMHGWKRSRSSMYVHKKLLEARQKIVQLD